MIYGPLRPFLLNRIKMVKDTVSTKLSFRLTSHNCPSPMRDYEAAVKTLNSLQSNAALLETYQKQGNRSPSTQALNLSLTSKFLSRTGISLDQLDNLSVIHVSGTKGKGSTCAFCESILRHHGFKTGFYSSPHLVAVRERIRVNGKPLTEENFSKYFWHVYNALYEKQEKEKDMPSYFKFLTVMAFNVFLMEKVDVAIIEVGIGGMYDCTNVLRKVPVVGVSSLGMDHTGILGKTIEEIASQKAGIFKKGAAAFSVQQSSNAHDVLFKKAAEQGCSLKLVPPLEEYNWKNVGVNILPSTEIQTINASLALQLANAWLEQSSGSSSPTDDLHSRIPNEHKLNVKAYPFTITPKMLTGLCKSSWPGRQQILHKGLVSFWLDGAHTVESIDLCIQWFLSNQKRFKEYSTVLIFNVGGQRDPLSFLKLLMKCKFDIAIFCPNVAENYTASSSVEVNNYQPTP